MFRGVCVDSLLPRWCARLILFQNQGANAIDWLSRCTITSHCMAVPKSVCAGVSKGTECSILYQCSLSMLSLLVSLFFGCHCIEEISETAGHQVF